MDIKKSGTNHSFFLSYLRMLVHIIIKMIRIGVRAMAECNILVYGSGNCEIAALLEEEMTRLIQLECLELKIFVRNYILENSCLAMYKRFSPLKEKLGQVKKGGLHEYFYDGENKVERQEMELKSSAHKERFEECLQIGIKRMDAEQVLLVLIGQSSESGLFWDFAEDGPSKLTYEELWQVLYRLGKRNHIQFDLVMDIPIWHGIEVPYMLVKHPYVKSLFIYERHNPLMILPIASWIMRAKIEKKSYLEVLYKNFSGYHIIMEQPIWQLCKMNWKAYWQQPGHPTWKQFYESYKKAVVYSAPKAIDHKVKIYFKEELMPTQNNAISEKELQSYLVQMYHTTFDEKNIKLWLKEFKACVDYYKM